MRMMKGRLYPEDYLKEAADVTNIITKKEGLMYEIAQAFLSMEKRFNIDDEPIDYAKNPRKYIKVRYNNALTATVKQAEFKNFPAAKVKTLGTARPEFDVIAEGPFQHNFEYLLSCLKKINVSVLVAVGTPQAAGGEKYFNYMRKASIISCEDFIRDTTSYTGELSEDLIKTEIEFFKYDSDENNGEFYIMRVPWEDHGLPKFTDNDKRVLALFFAHGKSACYHCSAGIGRSPALLMMKMAYLRIFIHPNYLQLSNMELALEFMQIIYNIKTVKPGAGEIHQVLAVLGLAEDASLLYKPLINVQYLQSLLITPTAAANPAIEKESGATSASLPKLSAITTPNLLSFQPKSNAATSNGKSLLACDEEYIDPYDPSLLSESRAGHNADQSEVADDAHSSEYLVGQHNSAPRSPAEADSDDSQKRASPTGVDGVASNRPSKYIRK